MTYQEFKERQQKEVNNFPIMFAFNNQQFNEGCERLGIHPDKAKEGLFSIGGGGFIRKTDSETFNNMLDRLSDELSEALQIYEFALDAFRYELANHEYIITGDLEPTLSALGLTLEKVKESTDLVNALTEARKQTVESMTA